MEPLPIPFDPGNMKDHEIEQTKRIVYMMVGCHFSKSAADWIRENLEYVTVR